MGPFHDIEARDAVAIRIIPSNIGECRMIKTEPSRILEGGHGGLLHVILEGGNCNVNGVLGYTALSVT